MWKRFRSNIGAMVGVAILLAVILIAVCAPLIYPHGPWQMVQRPFLPPMSVDGLPLGTDTLGRNVAAQLAYGAQVSLLVGLVSTIVALLIGVPLGAVAGFYGNWVDEGAMRFTEFFQTIPNFALAIVLVAIFEPTLASITLAIAIVSWPPVARLVRAEVMSVRKREFVDAATLAGLSRPKILITQVLPNTVSPIIVMASLMVATAILLESSLSFLGLGDPNAMSWGYMIGAARTVIRTSWWLSFFPGIAIVLTVLALNLIGEGLNDALNPHLSRKGRA
ncbi:ABC transporter permease [Thalassovita mangrovi]|uniref:ABC transporter permease subunit n=1 Tax=Thalassovita mangrovi TaxID=2692236 RepID=A0A6L8LIH5_9RHOB|nr:ABC transporter permease [Thalassovita mangrovi]MYM55827.1 ABC transporter permease subunit [Thalassovita mangrovi]